MKCIESECSEEAGTPWTDYWCVKHDKERRDRITEQLEKLAEKGLKE